MPDIQTAMKQALSKTLVEWDDDEAPASPSVQPVSTSLPTTNTMTNTMTNTETQPHRFRIKNNVSRATFNYIKNNPGSTRKEIIKALEYDGYAEASTSSLISQLRKTFQIHLTNDVYYADVPEYVPIKSKKYAKKSKQTTNVEVKPKRKYTKQIKQTTTGIGALLKAKLDAAPAYVPDETPPIVPERKGFVSLVRNRTPESIVDNMTVYQARELYLHLKEMFGG